MKRVFILILDSFGIGSSADAIKFGDLGSNTLGHISEYCQNEFLNKKRKNILKLPNMVKLGLLKVLKKSSGIFPIIGKNKKSNIVGAYSYAQEISSGKDTTSGHWEISGVPILNNWGYFIKNKNSIPKKILNKIIIDYNLPGFLGNCHASGTDIINKLGIEHIFSKKPIIYTSKDSVLQIACHEKFFGLKNLYNLCKITRKILTDGNYNIARVIARPFLGNKPGEFERTKNRLDISMIPPEETVLQKFINEKNGNVIAIGKISDIYANVGITKKILSTGTKDLFQSTINEIDKSKNNTLILTNFVDFDSLYGHRRDVYGYAKELEIFDSLLPKLIKKIKSKDMLIITSDHGCDPTWHGTDHTREYIPILIYGLNIKPGFYGKRKTFADIGQTVANYFNLSPMKYGQKIL
ncbi:phosphopentomutase [Sodalis-like secondary symbiont of Drepanosiphum platanoidis]|uniref:phosphopentomutase n=1 Tax=Sodalis-like secondary symbiont of Drepanosiphum platanoidis TaxID=2994493 RepID=UPI003463E553